MSGKQVILHFGVSRAKLAGLLDVSRETAVSPFAGRVTLQILHFSKAAFINKYINHFVFISIRINSKKKEKKHKKMKRCR